MRGADFFSPKELILRETTQEKLMSYYLGLPIDLSGKFASPLRADKSPGCSFWYSPKGRLYFHDFAAGKMYDWVDVIKAKYDCGFAAAMRIAINDLPLINGLSGAVKAVDDKRMDVILDTKRDHDYWASYGISTTTLQLFDVYTAKAVYIDDDLAARSTPKNPIFVYKFPSGRLKLYRPLGPKKTKWSGNATGEDIGGMNCFPSRGVLCFITSSIKDAMVLKELGFPAVCMNGEGYGIKGTTKALMDQLVSTLKRRFRYCLFLLDGDEAGLKFGSQLSAIHRIPYVVMPKTKDISDFMRTYGYALTFKRLKKLISSKFKSDINVPY